MMLATLLFYFFSLDGVIVLWEGCVLFGILIIFTFILIRNSRRSTKKAMAAEKADEDESDAEIENIKDNPLISTALLLAGLVALYFGAEWLVDGAIAVAKKFGMSERVIAVTVVAFGTSVPELVTSAVAAFRKQTDISVGNLIGSNIFNIMAVIGLTAIVHPINVSDATINSDMWWVIGIAAALLPLMVIGKKIGRFKGILLCSSYIVYITLIVMSIQ